MPDTVDARIPLALNPQPDPIKQMLGAQQVAANQFDMRAQQQAAAAQMAMKNVFADPANLTPEGTLKPSALAQIYAVDPKAGMAVQQFGTQQQKAALDIKGKEADITIAGHQMIEDKVRFPSIIAYDRAKERGLTDQAASAVAQQVYNDGMKDVKGSGLFSEQQISQMPPDFDYSRVLPRSQNYLAYQEKQRADKRLEAQQSETIRHDKAEEGIQGGNLGVARENVGIRREELQFNRDLLKEPKYSAPVAVQTKGPDDKPVVREAQQDNNPRSKTYGQWVTADEKHEPVGSPERVIKGAVPSEGGKLTPDMLKTMSEQYLAGDKSIFQNLGRGAQGPENVIALRGEIAKQMAERGMSGADMAVKMAEFEGLKAGERTLGSRTANIEMAVNEAKKVIPIALNASEKVDRTKYPTLNSIILASEKGTGGEDVVKLLTATNSLISVYSRAISPTGVPTVSGQEHARELLSAAYAKGQYRAAVDVMSQEMEAAQASPGSVRQGFREGYGGAAPPPAAPPAWAPSAGPGGAGGDIFAPSSKADYEALPVGAHYRKDSDPEGSYRVKK